MSWFFMISLASFVICVQILRHSTDDIAYLAVSLSLVSLVLSLVAAPLPIHLLIFILLLVSYREKPLVSHNSSESHEEKKAKLLYRGVGYKLPPPIPEDVEAETVGKYRGGVWKYHGLVQTSIPQQACKLKYRGVTVAPNQKALIPLVNSSELEKVQDTLTNEVLIFNR